MKLKLKLTLSILLLISLVGCSDEPPPTPPTPVTINQTAPTATADAAAQTAVPPTTDVPSGTELPAMTEVPPITGGIQGTPVSRSAIPERVNLQGSPASTIADTNSYYRLQTLLLEKESKCLEGNRRAGDSFLQGAAFMDGCQNVTGQSWKIVPSTQQGYYRLQTRFLEEQNKCFEGNQIGPDAVLDGSAFMSDCSDATGINWKFVDAGNGYYRMQTQLAEAQNRCLDGNRLGGSVLQQGAAFMDFCKDVPGQLWKLVPVTAADASTAVDREVLDVQASTSAIIADTSVYYRLQTLGADAGSKCLEGNRLGGSVLQGAAFMDDCKDVLGQMWHIIPTDRPEYYHLQPKALEQEFKCLDGNQFVPGAVLDGAAYMNDCTNDPEQKWKFVDAGNGSYRIQAESLETQNKCLQGNRLGAQSVLGGATFMATCQNADDQLWKLVPMPGTTTIIDTGTPSPK